MMKTVPTKTTLLNFYCTALFVPLLLAAPLLSVAAEGKAPDSKNDSRFYIQVTKVQNSKKHKIHFYSNPLEGKLYLAANGLGGKSCQLYVFDMDGNLVSRTLVREKETCAVNRMVQGKYFFEVFISDEQIETGQLTVK
jgi:hypothetical protein